MITVPVRQITRATPRIRILNLDLRAIEFSFTAGQAVMLGLSGSPLRKPYSIASAPWEVMKSGIMQVLVQVEDSGGLDPHLELASPGTPIDVEGPFGSFQLPAHVEHPLVFIAGGTGIAPLRSMMMEHLGKPTTQPAVLIYSARAVDEFAFRAELAALEAAGRLTAFFTVTREEREWQGRRGRIAEALLREALPTSDATCLVCGPPQFNEDASRLLLKLGVAESRILTEKY
jgi:ferredoxin-NADP reductase